MSGTFGEFFAAIDTPGNESKTESKTVLLLSFLLDNNRQLYHSIRLKKPIDTLDKPIQKAYKGSSTLPHPIKGMSSHSMACSRNAPRSILPGFPSVKTLLESKRNRPVAFLTFSQYDITWNTCPTAQFVVFMFTHSVSGVSGKSVCEQGRSILKGGSAMSNENNTLTVGRSVEEDQSTSSVVQEAFAAENCSAQCPTCQQTCDYSAGHTGLHHCPDGHEWV